ncbi:MAG: ISAs1 family transposase, partial [Proteobacteria bacterium]
MGKDQRPSIPNHFAILTDPGRENKRYRLIDIITVAICAVICNADSFAHIYEFGQARHKWFKTFLKLPHGIPSADTFERVFARIDPKAFKACFMQWVQAISQL